MTSGGRGAVGRLAPLLVAVATLVVPLAGIALGALDRPPPEPLVLVLAPTPEPEPGLVADLEPTPVPLPPVQFEPPLATPRPQPQLPSPFPRWTREDSLNLLLLGVDRRETDVIYRTDTIILANLDLRTRHAALISIPRDLIVNIPGYGQDRINTVYTVGEVEKRSGGGIGLLRDTVERNFGVTINHYAMVDFNCFRGAVDALGGVTVTVPDRIYDPFYPTDDYGYKVVRFDAGLQWMDGEHALEYARTRYGDTDFGRMRRQQQILTALKEQAVQVRNLSGLPQAVRACTGLSSDLNVLDLVALGSTARDIRQSDITLKVIDERMAVRYIAPSGADVLLPRWDEIRAMIRASMPSTTASAAAAN